MFAWLSLHLICLAKSVSIAIPDPLVVGSVARSDLPSTPYPTMYPVNVNEKSPSPLDTVRPDAKVHFWKSYIAQFFDEQMLWHSAKEKKPSYLAMELTYQVQTLFKYSDTTCPMCSTLNEVLIYNWLYDSDMHVHEDPCKMSMYPCIWSSKLLSRVNI